MFTLLTSEFGHAKDVLLKVAKSFFSPPSLAFLTLSGCLCGVCRAVQTEDDCVCVCVCVCLCSCVCCCECVCVCVCVRGFVSVAPYCGGCVCVCLCVCVCAYACAWSERFT